MENEKREGKLCEFTGCLNPAYDRIFGEWLCISHSKTMNRDDHSYSEDGDQRKKFIEYELEDALRNTRKGDGLSLEKVAYIINQVFDPYEQQYLKDNIHGND